MHQGQSRPHQRIPLLEIEQKSLIDILLRRSAGLTGHARVKGLIGEFIAC
jgi:hypothetical protein